MICTATQEFHWTARYKYSASYMTPGRFLLHLITIQDFRNASKIKRRLFQKSAVRSRMTVKSAARLEKEVSPCTGLCCPVRRAAAALASAPGGDL